MYNNQSYTIPVNLRSRCNFVLGDYSKIFKSDKIEQCGAWQLSSSTVDGNGINWWRLTNGSWQHSTKQLKVTWVYNKEAKKKVFVEGDLV